MYPIEEFVRNRMKELGLSPKDMARKAGYKDISKGMRRVEMFLPEGRRGGLVEERLHEILEVDRAVVDEKLKETRNIMGEMEEAARRARYYPHIHVLTERSRPSSLTFCGMTGMYQFKQVRLPNNFNEKSEEDRLWLIRCGINASLAHHQGSIPFFGKITGFVVSRYYEDFYQDCEAYDLSGNPMENPLGKGESRPPSAIQVRTVKGNLDLTNILAN